MDVSAAPSLPLFELAQTGLVDGLESLTVTGVNHEQARALLGARWPALRRLEVSFPGSSVAWQDASALLSVEQLSLSGGQGWGDALVQSAAPRLRELQLRGVDEATLGGVPVAPWFDALESLRIGFFAPTSALFSFPAALRLLVFRGAPLSPATLRQVFALPHLARLEVEWTGELERAVDTAVQARALRGLTFWCARDVTGVHDWLKVVPALERLELQQLPNLSLALARGLARHSSLATLSVWCGGIENGADAVLRERFGNGLVLGKPVP